MAKDDKADKTDAEVRAEKSQAWHAAAQAYGANPNLVEFSHGFRWYDRSGITDERAREIWMLQKLRMEAAEDERVRREKEKKAS